MNLFSDYFIGLPNGTSSFTVNQNGLSSTSAAKSIAFDSTPAIIFGSATASFCVEKFGTEKLVGLAQDQVDDRVQEFVDLVQFDIALV